MSYCSSEELAKALDKVEGGTTNYNAWHAISEEDKKIWEGIKAKLDKPLPLIANPFKNPHQITIEEYLDKKIQQEFIEALKTLAEKNPSTQAVNVPKKLC